MTKIPLERDKSEVILFKKLVKHNLFEWILLDSWWIYASLIQLPYILHRRPLIFGHHIGGSAVTVYTMLKNVVPLGAHELMTHRSGDIAGCDGVSFPKWFKCYRNVWLSSLTTLINRATPVGVAPNCPQLLFQDLGFGVHESSDSAISRSGIPGWLTKPCTRCAALRVTLWQDTNPSGYRIPSQLVAQSSFPLPEAGMCQSGLQSLFFYSWQYVLNLMPCGKPFATLHCCRVIGRSQPHCCRKHCAREDHVMERGHWRWIDSVDHRNRTDWSYRFVEKLNIVV